MLKMKSLCVEFAESLYCVIIKNCKKSKNVKCKTCSNVESEHTKTKAA